eukprot:TRINITY_DN38726_c0_g3_i2.p1 TRINITY_DN38726_c0_g3~~TRINITY_DN38726_c0_g3_i2.p1  ORF type:complete len:2297 (-),score=462.17 TRINITY_DN38726_c0_g3_i2:402-6704(-)
MSLCVEEPAGEAALEKSAAVAEVPTPQHVAAERGCDRLPVMAEREQLRQVAQEQPVSGARETHQAADGKEGLALANSSNVAASLQGLVFEPTPPADAGVQQDTLRLYETEPVPLLAGPAEEPAGRAADKQVQQAAPLLLAAAQSAAEETVPAALQGEDVAAPMPQGGYDGRRAHNDLAVFPDTVVDARPPAAAHDAEHAAAEAAEDELANGDEFVLEDHSLGHDGQQEDPWPYIQELPERFEQGKDRAMTGLAESPSCIRKTDDVDTVEEQPAAVTLGDPSSPTAARVDEHNGRYPPCQLASPRETHADGAAARTSGESNDNLQRHRQAVEDITDAFCGVQDGYVEENEETHPVQAAAPSRDPQGSASGSQTNDRVDDKETVPADMQQALPEDAVPSAVTLPDGAQVLIGADEGFSEALHDHDESDSQEVVKGDAAVLVPPFVAAEAFQHMQTGFQQDQLAVACGTWQHEKHEQTERHGGLIMTSNIADEAAMAAREPFMHASQHLQPVAPMYYQSPAVHGQPPHGWSAAAARQMPPPPPTSRQDSAAYWDWRAAARRQATPKAAVGPKAVQRMRHPVVAFFQNFPAVLEAQAARERSSAADAAGNADAVSRGVGTAPFLCWDDLSQCTVPGGEEGQAQERLGQAGTPSAEASQAAPQGGDMQIVEILLPDEKPIAASPRISETELAAFMRARGAPEASVQAALGLLVRLPSHARLLERLRADFGDADLAASLFPASRGAVRMPAASESKVDSVPAPLSATEKTSDVAVAAVEATEVERPGPAPAYSAEPSAAFQATTAPAKAEPLPFSGFQTAAGRSVYIPPEAIQKANERMLAVASRPQAAQREHLADDGRLAGHGSWVQGSAGLQAAQPLQPSEQQSSTDGQYPRNGFAGAGEQSVSMHLGAERQAEACMDGAHPAHHRQLGTAPQAAGRLCGHAKRGTSYEVVQMDASPMIPPSAEAGSALDVGSIATTARQTFMMNGPSGSALQRHTDEPARVSLTSCVEEQRAEALFGKASHNPRHGRNASFAPSPVQTGFTTAGGQSVVLPPNALRQAQAFLRTCEPEVGQAGQRGQEQGHGDASNSCAMPQEHAPPPQRHSPQLLHQAPQLPTAASGQHRWQDLHDWHHRRQQEGNLQDRPVMPSAQNSANATWQPALAEKPPPCGFMTAAGHAVEIPAAAIERARAMFGGCAAEAEQRANAQQRDNQHARSAVIEASLQGPSECRARGSGEAQDAAPAVLDVNHDTLDRRPTQAERPPACGFRTASEQAVQVPEAALARARLLIDEPSATGLQAPSCKPAISGEPPMPPQPKMDSVRMGLEDHVQLEAPPQRPPACGFQTASGHAIQVPAAALARACALIEAPGEMAGQLQDTGTAAVMRLPSHAIQSRSAGPADEDDDLPLSTLRPPQQVQRPAGVPGIVTAAQAIAQRCAVPLQQISSGPLAPFERFCHAVQVHFGKRVPAGRLARFGQQWFDNHIRQVALLNAAKQRRSPAAADGGMAALQRLLRRCAAELQGKRSLLRRVCEENAGNLAERHVVLLCAAVGWHSGTAGNAAPASIEVSDGWYSLPARLDEGLQLRAQRGELRAGCKLRLCLAKLGGVPAGGCDVLPVPDGVCLHLTVNACRPAAAGRHLWSPPGTRMYQQEHVVQHPPLGFQPRIYPPVRLADACEGGGAIPHVDVIVLRTFPLVFKSWPGEGGGGPDETSYSQECERAEKEWEDRAAKGLAAAAAGDVAGDEASAEPLQGQQDGLVDRGRSWQRSEKAPLEERRAQPQLILLVMDTQQIVRPRPADWWSSLAMITMPMSAAVSALEEGCYGGLDPSAGELELPIRPFDRLRLTCLRPANARQPASATAARSGPLRLYFQNRISSLQHCAYQGGRCGSGEGFAGVEAATLPGLLPGQAPPASPFLSAAGTLPLFTGQFTQVPPPYAAGQYCDLVGILLSVGEVQAPTPTRRDRWRSGFYCALLTPTGRLCRIAVEEYASDQNKVFEAVQRLRRSCAKLVSFSGCAEDSARQGPLFGGLGGPAGADAASSQVVAVENVTFSWYSGHNDLVLFRAQRLQLRISSKPTSPVLRQAISQTKGWISPEVIAEARARAELGGR